MLGADGRCKTLDSSADGYVRGESLASMLLQVMDADAELPANAIACVLGSSVNQDGRSSSLTAPNGPSQQAAIRAALQSASMQASDLTALQLHGTGTVILQRHRKYNRCSLLLLYFSSS